LVIPETWGILNLKYVDMFTSTVADSFFPCLDYPIRGDNGFREEHTRGGIQEAALRQESTFTWFLAEKRGIPNRGNQSHKGGRQWLSRSLGQNTRECRIAPVDPSFLLCGTWPGMHPSRDWT